MTDADFEQLIGPYLAGELDGETAARMRAYLEETPGRQGFVAGIRGAVRSEDVGVVPEVAASRQRLVEKLGRGVEGTFEGRLREGRANVARNRPIGGVYDCLGLRGRTLRGGMAWSGKQTLRGGLLAAVTLTVLITSVAMLARRGATSHVMNAAKIYATRADQHAIVNLDDRTQVTLAPRTTLRVLPFSAHTRTVFLDNGEAYFEVAHVSGAPFVVRSGGATARVLGTAFLVRHDANDSHVRVAVADGKIRMTLPSRSDTGFTLTQGQIADVTDSTVQASSMDDFAPNTELALGRVIFRHTPLATVLGAISRWYGYQFRYVDRTLATRNVTMIVSTRSSTEALAAIERVMLVNLTVVGDTVTLVSQPPQSGLSAPRIRTYDVWSSTREVGR